MSHENNFAERPLTERELETSRWLLDRGNAEAAGYLSQLSDATVIGVCGCGCASIDFAICGKKPESSGMHILSDHFWIDDSGHMGGVFVFATSGHLAGIEVYSIDGECDASELPILNKLKPLTEANNA